MAEFVQFRLEEMMPELEQMEKLKLFEKSEIKYVSQCELFSPMPHAGFVVDE